MSLMGTSSMNIKSTYVFALGLMWISSRLLRDPTMVLKSMV